MNVSQGFLLAAVFTVLAVWGDGAFAQTNAERQQYQDLKARQAVLREEQRQRAAEMRRLRREEACIKYKNRQYKTPMNTRLAPWCE